MKRKLRQHLAWLAVLWAMGAGCARAADTCKRVVLQGEVSAGQEWKSDLGEGWVFRLVPVPPLHAHYSGWDLVVDRAQPAGFPDALYLATPPYKSINQREIGTTYGLRAQDAIGWNPRSFRFVTDPSAFKQAQRDYSAAYELHKDAVPKEAIAAASARLLNLVAGASSGELRIVDARLVPGVADPAPFAERWAMAAARTQHEIEPAPDGRASPRGELRWIRFTISLWLPVRWTLPGTLSGANSACGQ